MGFSALSTPVLLVIFNRPDTTRRVFEAIREAKPKRLYVAADGPRPGVTSDLVLCEEARNVVSQVDWDCQVRTLFRETNLKCGIGPSSAFTWFFEQEEAGIILEDDCLPSQSFFLFCEELLARYRSDTRVMHIGGNNFLDGWRKDDDYSYYFSQSGHIWGWATWRRAWKAFDFNISLFQKLVEKGYFQRFFMGPLEKFYRLRKLQQSTAEGVTWWDYQWDFARYAQEGLSIVPQINLVRNIGFGESATHTHNSRSKHAELQASEIDFPLRHPPFMIRDLESDRKYFQKFTLETLRSKMP